MDMARMLTRWTGIGVIALAAQPALAELKYFALAHEGGRCAERKFIYDLEPWSRLSTRRIDIATGESIRVTLYGHGAEHATNATGSNIFEWLGSKGTTTNYPNPTIMFGKTIPIGFVQVKVRADDSHGTGNRTVTVHWPTGNETIPMRIVARCEDLQSFRTDIGVASTNPLPPKPLTSCVPTAAQPTCP